MASPSVPYPKPGPTGGVLCRLVVEAFRGFEVKLDASSERLLVAVSGGVDSLALAQLLIKYGRRIVAPEQIGVLHLSHQWRPGKAGVEAAFVERFAKNHGVSFHHVLLKPPPRAGKNWEEDARKKRQEVYRQLAGPLAPYRYVCTAHHRNDVAETNLWRILRGQWGTHSDGILGVHQSELRPLLKVRKEQLLEFCKEEKIKYLRDSTNLQVSYFRGRIRKQIFPLLAKTGFDPIEGFARLSDS